ncbi:BON domain-containing protein [bacterium]|nr:MAG: BON domain-containing protein [bacterium]
MFPFCKKTPPSRVDVAKKAVSDAAHAIIDAVPTELIEEKFDDLKKSAAVAALHAAQVAHHASEVASHKFEELQHAASTFGESASDAAHRATESAHRASENAHAAGEGAAAAAAAKAKEAREAAVAARESLQGKAGFLVGSAVALKESLQDRASHDIEAGKANALHAKESALAAKAAAEKAAHDKVDEVKSRFASKKAEVEEQVAAVEVPKLPTVKNGAIQVEYADSGSKWGWILLGLAVGAVLALLFAPTSGRRSRAAIKDRLDKVTDGASDAAAATSDKVVDIAHRVEGIAHKVEAKIHADAEGDDDSTIADRVRSVLGHHDAVKSIDRINVDSNEGVITLRGPIVDQATEDIIIAVVKTIPGVKDVIADFLIDNPVDPANSVA